MRYLRTLSNSLVAAVIGTGYLLVLFLHLNPRLSIAPDGLVSLARTLGLFYVVNLTAGFYVLLVLGQLVSTAFSPAWLSAGVLGWLGAATTGSAALLMWTNLQTFEIVLTEETRAGMTEGAFLLAICSLLLIAISLARRATDRSFRWWWGLSVVVVLIVSLAGPLWRRGAARIPPLEARPLDTTAPVTRVDHNARVTIVAVDAGSLELITKATAEGRLPNFGRILDAGAVMHLATLQPTSIEAVWSAVATGKFPQKNGVRSSGLYHVVGSSLTLRLLPDYCFASRLVRFGFLEEEPHTSMAMLTRPFWSILSSQGVTVGVLNWPLTYPAPSVRGYIVSDAYARLALTTSGFDDRALLHPPELREEVLPVMRSVLTDPSVVVPVRTGAALDERYLSAGRTDLLYDQIGRELSVTRPTQVSALRFQCLDAIGHYFLRYAMPAAFGNVPDAEQARLGPVLESHYGPIDEAIGRAIDSLGSADLLLVVSGFGMEPLGFGKRVLERLIGDPGISGTHERAPDGFLIAYGASVAKRRLPRAAIVDVVPTVLYFLGLPVGRDMDGAPRPDIFTPEFTRERPIAFIPTYDR